MAPEGLEYGIVGIISAKSTGEIAPFGGMKESGIDCNPPAVLPRQPRLPHRRHLRTLTVEP
jgi:hypothetical protein